MLPCRSTRGVSPPLFTCSRLLPPPPHLPRFKEDKENEVLCTQVLDSDDLDQLRDAVAEDYYFQVLAGQKGGGV